MRFKKYEVSDMKEAMRVIKEDLGPDAIILSTKPIMKHKNLGLLAKPAIEVIATADYKSTSEQPNGKYPPPKRGSLDVIVNDETDEPIKRKSNIGSNMNSGVATKQDSFQSDILNDLASHTAPDTEYTKQSNNDGLYNFSSRGALGPLNYTANNQLRTTSYKKSVSGNNISNNASGTALSPHDGRLDTLLEEVSMIKKQLLDIKSANPAVVSLNINDRLKDFYNTLCKSGVDGVIAYRLLKDFEKIISDSYSNIQIKNLLVEELSELINIEKDYSGLMSSNVMAFVGPTGVGKTTTVAKIAANLKLKDNKSVALITIDSYRIGAVEQLKTYAEIVGMPLYVASSPDELRRLLNELKKSYDNILIDSMGRSQYDAKEIELLRSFVSFDNTINVSLLLSLSSNHNEMLDTLDRYSVLHPKYIILTKLDETKYFGPLINIPLKKKLPLLLLTTGQNVPDDIEIPDGRKIARKLLQDIPTLWGDSK